MQKIIYKTDDGIAIIQPSDKALLKHTIEEIAQKDVPNGVPFKIVDDSVIPSDRTFRSAWEVDETELTDGVGSDHDVFVTDPSHPSYVDPKAEAKALAAEQEAAIEQARLAALTEIEE